jgi:HEAT repeat protein
MRFGLTFASVLFFILACDTGPKAGQEAEYWGKKINDQQAELAKREAAFNHLNDLKDKKSLPFLYEALKQKGVGLELKPKVAELIGIIGDETSVDPLIGAIDAAAGAGRDKETRLAANANERIAKALGKIAKPNDPKAVEALKRLVGNNSQDVQLAAIFSLGELKATDAVQDLVEVADGHPNNFMVKNAVEALGKIQDKRAAPVLGKLLFFERQGVSFYREASYALFLLGKDAVPTLDEIYEGKFKAIDELHVEPNVQKTKAIVVYGDLALPETNKKVVAGVDANGNDTATALLRIESQRAAGRNGLKEAVAGLKNRYDNVDISQSEHALAALAQIGVKDMADAIYGITTSAGFLKNCTKDGNSEDQCKFSEANVRKPRILTYSRLGSDPSKMEALLKEEKLDTLKAFITESKERVDAAAQCKSDVKCWIGKLQDKSPRVRERAAYELTWADTDEARDALLGALKDEDNETRYAAIIGVGRRLPKDPAAADAVAKQLADEKGKTQFIRVNEDLKRLEIRMRRGY